MANTIPDISSVNGSFTDVYTSSGITVGTSIIIQNKSTSALYVQISALQPLSTSTDGVYIQPYQFYVVDAGEVGCWIRGNGKICVQDNS